MSGGGIEVVLTLVQQEEILVSSIHQFVSMEFLIVTHHVVTPG